MNKYYVEYFRWNSEWLKKIKESKEIVAEDVRSALRQVEDNCALNYMCCEVVEIRFIEEVKQHG